MTRLSERLSHWGRRQPAIWKFANRYGRSYWRLPKVLRRRICWERNVPKLGDVEKVLVGPPERVEPIINQNEALRQPLTFGHHLIAQGYRSPAPFVARLPKAWLVGQYASAVTCDGQLTLGAFRDEPRLLGLERRPELEAWIEARAWEKTSDLPPLNHVYSMVNRLQGNYFHWIVEWCGRLEWLDVYRQQTNRAPRLLIPQGGPGYLRPSLKLLGYGAEDLLEWPTDSLPRQARELLIPSFRGSSPAALRWLRARFLEAASITEINGWRKIYIPRRAGTWRNVLNSGEVEEFLCQQGFEILDPQTLSFEEQIRVFSEARLIVGLHGSGMTNVLFAPQAAMFELFGNYGDGVFFGMTSRFGQWYESMRCQSVGENVAVDLEALRQRVDALDARWAKTSRATSAPTPNCGVTYNDFPPGT